MSKKPLLKKNAFVQEITKIPFPRDMNIMGVMREKCFFNKNTIFHKWSQNIVLILKIVIWRELWAKIRFFNEKNYFSTETLFFNKKNDFSQVITKDRYFREMLILRELREKDDFPIKNLFQNWSQNIVLLCEMFILRNKGFSKNTTKNVLGRGWEERIVISVKCWY